jgi:hypothetical protein
METGLTAHVTGFERNRLLASTSDTIFCNVLRRCDGNPHRTLRKSDLCGCFYCLEVFPSNGIQDWTDDGDTALCPKCGIDSVIGSVSGYPIQREFLSKMHDHWF